MESPLRWYHMMTGLFILFVPSAFITMLVAIYLFAMNWPAIQLVEQQLFELIKENIMLITGIESLIGLIFLVSVPVIRRHFLNSLRLEVFKDWRTYLFWFGGIVAINLATLAFQNVTGLDDVQKQVDAFQLRTIYEEQSRLIYLIVFFIAVILIPIKEELIFRGLLFDWLRGLPIRYAVWFAAVLQAVVFGSLHTGVAFSAGLIGLFFALIYLHSRSLGLCIAMHMSINALAFLAQTFAMPTN